jgi:hypothetical protein
MWYERDKEVITRNYTLHDHFRQRQHSSHYDLRILSINKQFTYSFAFPKKKFPSENNKVLAIKTPDHPLSILSLSGTLKNNDKMSIVEKGECSIVSISSSKIDIIFNGEILNGHFIFIHLNNDSWLVLMKRK